MITLKLCKIIYANEDKDKMLVWDNRLYFGGTIDPDEKALLGESDCLEPEYTVVDDSFEEIPILLDVKVDFLRFKCSSKKIEFMNSYLNEVRFIIEEVIKTFINVRYFRNQIPVLQLKICALFQWMLYGL